MSSIVADAGPLHYLVLIDCGDMLGDLFDLVLVPFGVRDELMHPNAPEKVRDWLRRPPSWLQMVLVTRAPAVQGLHRGETETLQAALERRADAVLMDDLDGRDAARRLGIPAIFTVAILERAAEKNLIDLSATITKLQQTSFFISQAVLDAALERDRRRREQQK